MEVRENLEDMSSQELFDLAENIGVVFTDAPPLDILRTRIRRLAYG